VKHWFFLTFGESELFQMPLQSISYMFLDKQFIESYKKSAKHNDSEVQYNIFHQK